MECGCWLTDDLTKVEGVCDAHKEWQTAMSAHAYAVAEDRQRERCAKYVEDMLAHGDVLDWQGMPNAIRNGSNPH